MTYKKILTIQDVSCVGQCSLTVALPILSACGVETCVLPSAVLSTHTGGFKGFTFRDLTEDMPAIKEHWKREGIAFDAIYTGYLGSVNQIDYVAAIMDEVGAADCVRVVDPAMADNGKLYVGFDGDFVKAMRSLCGKADYLVPNISEACFLTDTPYTPTSDREFIDGLLQKLTALGCRHVVMTGVSYQPGKTGVVVLENGVYSYYEHDQITKGCHGTGDVYASAFVGALMRGKPTLVAAQIAADYVVECIRFTQTLPDHWYGAAFEPVLPKLMAALEG